jgi:hypothetical protein
MNRNGIKWGWSIGSTNWRWPDVNQENVALWLFLLTSFMGLFTNMVEPMILTAVLWLNERIE